MWRSELPEGEERCVYTTSTTTETTTTTTTTMSISRRRWSTSLALGSTSLMAPVSSGAAVKLESGSNSSVLPFALTVVCCITICASVGVLITCIRAKQTVLAVQERGPAPSSVGFPKYESDQSQLQLHHTMTGQPTMTSASTLPRGKNYHYFLSHKKSHSSLGAVMEAAANGVHDNFEALTSTTSRQSPRMSFVIVSKIVSRW